MSTPNAQASSSKHHSGHKSKHSHRDNDAHKHKSKKRTEGKEKSSSSSSSSSKSPYEHRQCRMRLSIPPKYALDWMAGIKDVLDGMLMRYVSQLEGVLLSHTNHDLMDDTLKIIDECPYGVSEVTFDALLWSPKIGQRLYGTHSLSSPSHLSLLFAKTFNISIPLQHIPQDTYDFEASVEDEDDDDSEAGSDTGMDAVEEVGRWRNIKTQKLIGEEEGSKGIKFTVIGMQVNNHILSLTGSLLKDPSNPPAPPSPTVAARVASPSLSPEPVRPAKQARVVQTHDEEAGEGEDHGNVAFEEPQAVEPVDDRYLSARELKKKRKDDEKKKRDARKARKEGRDIEALEEAGAGTMVSLPGGQGTAAATAGAKRKANPEGEEGKKKRKVTS